MLEPGGAQLSALRLSRALRPHGIDTTIVAGDATPAGLEVARAHGFEVEHFSEVRGLQWEPCDEFAGWLAERLAGADLVHGHMFGAWRAAVRACALSSPTLPPAAPGRRASGCRATASSPASPWSRASTAARRPICRR